MAYRTVTVEFEHTTRDSDTVRQNRAVLTVWGDSDLKVLSELKKQYPDYRNIDVLEVEEQ